MSRQVFIPHILQGYPLPAEIQHSLASRRKFIPWTGPQAPTSAVGALSIIRLGSGAGEQDFSVLPSLGHPLVLRIDFALEFLVQIDCSSQTWKPRSSVTTPW
ncbi:hypothetical protein KQX54_011572 [Cotesia glomerata]|uniref:Uncharacterized protein n=1 Tax=Cotesia glomerata TaxID=32391 RepID=A0AAV7IBI1_COTGL|nr:hypothetical protein KQX54_011572 [Cotesia glomerata]